MKLAVGIPSRGLIHSRTIEQVLDNTSSLVAYYFFTHDLPIPTCFNSIAERFVDSDATHLWLVEEDMNLPHNVLESLIKADAPIATIDYPVSPTISAVSHNGKYLLGGTGCILIAREVLEHFELLGEPYFRQISRNADTLEPLNFPAVYGSHDIDFYIRVQDAGYTIKVVDELGGQWRVKQMGQAEMNVGAHQIELL